MGDGGARAEFLAAGRELLDDASLADYLGRAITVEALCRRSGRSPGGFYHHWRSVDAYCRDLVLTSVDDANRRLVDHLVGEFAALPDDAGAAGLFDQLRAFLANYVDTVIETPWGARAELLVWISNDDELRAALDARTYELEEVAARVIPDVLDAWARELRTPWDTDMVVRSVAVILWGAQILDRLHPSPVYRMMAVEMSLSVMALATRERRSDIDVDDFLRLSLGLGRDGPASPWAAALRDRTAAVVADLYRQGGWEAVTPAAVAEAADEYIQDIDVVWFGRAGFAAAVWAMEIVPDLDRALDGELESATLGSALSNHVTRLAQATRDDAAAAARLLTLAVTRVSPDNGPPADVLELTGLRAVTSRAVASASSGGDTVDDPSTPARAASLIRLTITETLARPHDAVDAIAADVVRLIGPTLRQDAE